MESAEYLVICLACGVIWTAKPGSFQEKRAKERVATGLTDPLPVHPSECSARRSKQEQEMMDVVGAQLGDEDLAREYEVRP